MPKFKMFTLVFLYIILHECWLCYVEIIIIFLHKFKLSYWWYQNFPQTLAKIVAFTLEKKKFSYFFKKKNTKFSKTFIGLNLHAKKNWKKNPIKIFICKKNNVIFSLCDKIKGV
jgi:hypothetical protein